MSGQKSLVDEVNAASHEQKRGLGPIAGSIPQVEQFTQKTAASAGVKHRGRPEAECAG
jgi:methyl-accepting chemotaxis protein